MEITKNKNGNNLIIELKGRLDSTTASELEASCKDELATIDSLELNIKDVDFISSKGIRIILFIKKSIKGKLIISNMNNSIKEVFRLSGLLDKLEIK